MSVFVFLRNELNHDGRFVISSTGSHNIELFALIKYWIYVIIELFPLEIIFSAIVHLIK